MRSCLIADDHELMRTALAQLVAARWPGVQVAEAADFPAALALAVEGFDLCLADLDMPGAEALPGVERLRAAAPDMPVLVVTGSHDDGTMLDLLAQGVAGFAPKTSSPAVLTAAIELVLAGGRYLPPRLVELHRAPATVPAGPLSARQVEVLRLVAAGQSNKDIAKTLGIAPATVKTHVAQLIAATGATNRTDAAMRARGAGLI